MQPEVLGTLPKSAINDLRARAEMAKLVDIDAVSTDTLIHAEPQWSELREQARRCLETLGFALSEWEHEEGLTQNGGGTNS